MTQARIGRRMVDVQWTVLDRAIAAISPARGIARWQQRAMMAVNGVGGGYEGGRRDKRATRNWRPFGGSADADTLPDLPDLRARARDLARNVPIATGAVATTVTNVGELRLQSQINGKALGLTDEQADAMELEQETEFALFCESADFTRVQHLGELGSLAHRSTLESGDCFLLRRYRLDAGDVYGTKVQLVEADRVSNPNRAPDYAVLPESNGNLLIAGVELDKDGVRQAFHISNRHPGDFRMQPTKWERVSARAAGKQTVIHLFDRLRADQTRGVPYLAPVIEHIKMLGRYTDAEVMAAVVNGMFTVAIETATAESAGPVIGETGPGVEANEVKLGYGAVLELAPGEEAKALNPGRPNPEFDPFVSSLLRQIGVALELPYELLIKHFTASYSASRAALEMAWQFFSARRAWLARRYYQAVYEWMMDEAVAIGRLNRPGYFEDAILRQAYLGAEWIGPNRPSLNPLQEAQADALDMANGVKTGEDVCAERTGGQIEKKTAQLGKEQKLRVANGLPPRAAPGTASAPADQKSGDQQADGAVPPAKKGAA